MQQQTPFSWRKRADSFRYAFAGIRTLFREEHNARIHLVAAVLAILAGVWLHISAGEWCAVVISICAVISAEAANSAIEAITDLASPGHHPLAGKAKDCAAAAVLIMAISAAIVGAIIFVPKIISIFCV